MFLGQRAQRFMEVARSGAGLCGALCSKRRRYAESFTTEGTEAHGCAARKRPWKTAFHAPQPKLARTKYWHTEAGQVSAEEPKVSFALPSVSREGGFQRFPWCPTNYHLTTSYLKGTKAA
jgi:hypothetical protein